MTVETILSELRNKGSESIKRIFLKHGIKEPLFGVRIEDLKVIQKRIKKDYQLSKDLYATGNADAMYLAGLIAEETKMTKKDLQTWVEQAESSTICGSIVPWIAAESNFGYEMALKWIDSPTVFIAIAGWSTLSSLVAIKEDRELDIAAIKKLLSRVEGTIHTSENRVRSAMNLFVIAVGSYVIPLSTSAMEVARKIGAVEVTRTGTACKVPDAGEYIKKVTARGILGKKRKMARC